MLVNLKEILSLKGLGQAVGCFNTPNIASLKAVIAAAETLNQPVIVAHAEVHEKLVSCETIGPAMISTAKGAKVPVCVHLDHGTSVEYCKRAISIGFTGIMFDGSLLPYEENIRHTREAARFAHESGVSIEAELGTIKNHEEVMRTPIADNIDMYTDPALAGDFVEQTHIDALAVTFGTVHGVYFKEPNLDFNRLKKINQCIDTPLVMHGGSGLSNENYRRAIDLGIEKINYFTYMSLAGGLAARAYIAGNELVYFHDIEVIAERAMRENVIKAIKVFSNI